MLYIDVHEQTKTNKRSQYSSQRALSPILDTDQSGGDETPRIIRTAKTRRLTFPSTFQ